MDLNRALLENNGKGKGNVQTGKGRDWSKGGPAGAGAGKGERPVGACSLCWDLLALLPCVPGTSGCGRGSPGGKGICGQRWRRMAKR